MKAKTKIYVYVLDDDNCRTEPEVVVVNDPSDSVQLRQMFSSVTNDWEYFECEAYHLKAFAEEHGLSYQDFERELSVDGESVKIVE